MAQGHRADYHERRKGKTLAGADGFLIAVTDEIIEKACRANSNHCMIAEAIRAARPDFCRVSVDIQTIRFTSTKTGKRYIYLTPRAAQVGIVRFDEAAPIDPFAFMLRQPAQIVQSAGRFKRGKTKPAEGEEGQPLESETPPKRSRATVRVKESHGEASNSITAPTKVGGRTPPVKKGNYGAIRRYGLRLGVAPILRNVGEH